MEDYNKSPKSQINILPITFAVIVILFACKTFYFRTQYHDINSLLHEKDSILKNSFLKAHLKNGDVSILQKTWTYDSTEQYIRGTGTKYDYNRVKIAEGPISIFIDSVAIFETNKSPKARIAALAIVAALDALLVIPCLAIPKACFGSCPTFYLKDGGQSTSIAAEGFSNAISPKMEYGDIDALGSFYAAQNAISITMKNEALETHCINELKLLAVPKTKYERIFHSNKDTFYRCTELILPTSAYGPEGEISDLLNKPDRNERFSLADDHNLASKEEIYLEFYSKKELNQPALLIHFRQTLMTTHFIYSAMGYMGDEVGDIFAAIETEKISANKIENGIYKELGDIEVHLLNPKSNTYDYQGSIYETGPIAINQQIIPLSETMTMPIKIKLILNKGLWRIDYLALTNIIEKSNPVILYPAALTNQGIEYCVGMEKLKDSTHHLISMPGNEFDITFQLPRLNQHYDLFLYSKGYYLEWMRAQWITDKNLIKLNQMIESPAQYLKAQTREYKSYELEMEKEFWNSKININSINHEIN